MLYVSFIAVGLAALRNANDLWAGVMLMLTLIALCTYLLAMLQRKGSDRFWSAGFVVFAAVYFVAVFGPFPELKSTLGTTQLIDYVRSEIVYPLGQDAVALAELEARYQQSLRYAEYFRKAGNLQRLTEANKECDIYRWILIEKNSKLVSGTLPPAFEARRRIRQFIPGAMHENSFRTIAHCLFALLAGLIGAFISLRMYQDLDRSSR